MIAMKKIKWILFFLLSFSNIYSQTKGIVHFEERMKLMIQTEDVDQTGSVMNSLPKELKGYKLLYFNPDASLYIKDKSKVQDPHNVEMNQEEDGPKMIMKIDEPDEQVFCDIAGNKRIEQRDLFDRKFLIESALNSMEWKLSGNQKEILGYPCQEAILKDSLIKLVVWFAPSLSVSTGPNGIANLPGMILEANRDEGKQIITATKIDFSDFDQTILVKPKEGKKVTKKEYNALVEAKRKEMQEENGGDGNVIIKIRH